MRIENVNNLNIPVKYKKVIRETINNLITANLEDLERVILFGSCARGEVKFGSDVDIMFITKYPVAKAIDRYKYYDLEYYDEGLPSTDIVINSEEFLLNSTSNFSITVKKDGLILWERGNI